MTASADEGTPSLCGKAERDELSKRTVGTDEYVLPLFLDWVELNTELCSPTSSV